MSLTLNLHRYDMTKVKHQKTLCILFYFLTQNPFTVHSFRRKQINQKAMEWPIYSTHKLEQSYRAAKTALKAFMRETCEV